MNLKLMNGDFKLSNIKMKELNFGKKARKGAQLDQKSFYLAKFPKFLRDLLEGVLLDFELYFTKGRRGIPSVFARTGLADPVVYVFNHMPQPKGGLKHKE